MSRQTDATVQAGTPMTVQVEGTRSRASRIGCLCGM